MSALTGKEKGQQRKHHTQKREHCKTPRRDAEQTPLKKNAASRKQKLSEPLTKRVINGEKTTTEKKLVAHNERKKIN